MKKAILLLGALGLAASTYALPVYDDFSGYGTAGTWTQVSGPPIVSYTTSAPWLGGNTAPSGESWIAYTNAPTADLYVNYYSGVAFTGYDKQSVAIVNYFGDGQPGATDAPDTSSLPSGFPGPFVPGLDTKTNSVWTPGWGQTGEVTPPLVNYLGGVGACLQFASPVLGTTGSKVFVSFFVDIPDCTGSYGAGQSLLHGYTAGFINTAELPSLSANQYALPGYSAAGYASVPLMEKFNIREGSATNATLPLTGVQAANEGIYHVVVTNEAGSIISSNASFYLVTVPSIGSQSPPTNPVVHYQSAVTLSAQTTAPGISDGFPLGYRWQFNRTNISGACTNSYSFFAIAGSEGTYSLVVTNAAGSNSRSWQLTTLYDTLAYHLSTNAVGYASGYTNVSDATIVLSAFSSVGTNLALLTNVVWSTNFWLRGVRGLSATCIGFSNQVDGGGMFDGQGLATMVSPRHYVCAQHMHPEGYAMIAFLDTNNVVYWRATLQRADVANDTSVGVLDSDLPPSVGYLPVLPQIFTNYLPTTAAMYIQGIGMNQDMRIFSQPMRFNSPPLVWWDCSQVIPFGLGTNWSFQVRPGDSSDPESFLINNQLVLVSHNWGAIYGPCYGFQIDAINQTMHYLSTNNNTGIEYQLTLFSLTNWPSIGGH